MSTFEQSQLVVKSNALIKRTRYSLSLQEQKILLYIISKIKPQDEDLLTYSVDLRELCDVCGISYNEKNFINFKESIQQLRDKSFWLETQTDILLVSWIESVKIDKIDKTVSFRLNDFLKPYLLQLRDNFTAYELGSVLVMKSKYSVRLYELLKSYAYLKSIQITLDDLKEKLQTAEYDRWQNFKDRVLEPALREISEYTDLTITYTTTRRGRKIHSLQFMIKQKTSAQQLKTKLKREAMLERDSR